MEPFIGQIMLFAGNFAPRGFALCNGQLLDIRSHSALFSILGTTYGGNGSNTFALPDLRGRGPMHFGQGHGLSNRKLGQRGGTETVKLDEQHMPSHTHHIQHVLPAEPKEPKIPGIGEGKPQDGTFADPIKNTGGSKAHENMAPYLCLNYCIALTGIFPSRN